MVQVQSKLLPITATCREYVHPWTESCCSFTAVMLVQSFKESFKIYSAVYLLPLLLRSGGRLPKKNELIKTAKSILQSTAFLTTHSFCYPMFLCLLRNTMGNFNILTVAFVPAFLASLCGILVERSSRRGLLTLYVANVATETVWKMLAARAIVTPIKYGQVIIFGLSSAVLMYYYRKGVHITQKDQIFSVIQYAVGPAESNAQTTLQSQKQPNDGLDHHRERSDNKKLSLIFRALNAYQCLVTRMKEQTRHSACPHTHSCTYYTLEGFTKLFGLGVGIQVTLKTVMQIKNIIKDPRVLKRIFLSRETVKLGLFFGGFVGLFRLSSCLLRHVTGRDSPAFAIPAALIASTAHAASMDVTIALYMMWKAVQISYNLGVEKGILPNVPGFGIFFYCTCTALLFHTTAVEPMNLRLSYWKFLHGLSGGMITEMGRECMDVWGLETTKRMQDVRAILKLK